MTNPSPRSLRRAQEALADAVDALRAGDLPRAARGAEEALGWVPDHADARELRALVRLRRGEDAAAAEDLLVALRDDEARPATWTNLARARLSHAPADAADAARRALALRPDLPEAWLVLAQAELALGHRDAAETAALAVVAARPSASAWTLLGLAQGSAGTAALREALRLDPTAVRWRFLGDALVADDATAALDAYAAALGLAPDDADTWARFGDALLLVREAPPAARAWLLAALDRPEVDAALLGPVCVAAAPHVPGLLAASLQKTLWRGEAAEALLATLDLPEKADQARIRGEVPGRPRAFPALTPVPDSAVRRLYEEAPYPWLVTVPRRTPRPFPDAVEELVGVRAGRERPAVLIAGCGTGRNVRAVVNRMEVGPVLAVDLSLASLTRAAEVCADLPAVRFAQADLRLLGSLPDRFDFIDSVGVVHHLEDPAAGVAVLGGLLRPGGLLRIGVYSARARAEIDDARRVVGDERTPAAVRRLLRGHPVARSVDFWTDPGLRDLLFHPVEHRYRPPELRGLLGGLRLLGLQPTHPRAAALRLGADLDAWESAEVDTPDLFAGMLVAWAVAD